MNLIDILLAAKLAGGGGGGADAVRYTQQSLTEAQQLQARKNINAASADVAPYPEANHEGFFLMAAEDGTASWAPLMNVINIAGANKTITPAGGNVYNFTESALTSLTITDPPATGSYIIKFNSGSTPTTTTIPATIHGLESFAAEANTHYEINVEDNYAVVGSWAVSV